MCVDITTPTEIISSIEDIERQGWAVLPEDIPEDHKQDYCLCGVDVEAILKRAGVNYEWSPFGFDVYPEEPEDLPDVC